MKENQKAKMKRAITWYLVDETLQKMGWQRVKKTADKFEYQRGNEMIITWKVSGTKKWKAELFFRRKLKQATGAHDDYFAKIFTMELAMHDPL